MAQSRLILRCHIPRWRFWTAIALVWTVSPFVSAERASDLGEAVGRWVVNGARFSVEPDEV